MRIEIVVFCLSTLIRLPKIKAFKTEPINSRKNCAKKKREEEKKKAWQPKQKQREKKLLFQKRKSLLKKIFSRNDGQTHK